MLLYAIAWLALTLAVEFALPWLMRFDAAVQRAVYVPGDPAVAAFLTHAGDTAVLAALGVCVAAALVRRRAWDELRLLVGAVCGVALVRLAVLWTVQRPRPTGASLTSWSYPSGHATYSCAAAFLLIVLARPRHPAWLLVWPVTVAVTRVVLGVHWPLDVLAGLTLSGIVVCACAAYASSPGARIGASLRFPHG